MRFAYTNKSFNLSCYLLIFSIFIGQFLIVPFFGDANLVAKALLTSSIIIPLFLFYINKYKIIRFHPVFYFYLIIVIISSLSSFLSVEPIGSFSHLGYLLVLILLSILVLSYSSHDNKFFLQFNASFLVLGVVASTLGLYEFFHTCLLGPSEVSLIPYLLPPDSSIRIGGMLGQANIFALFLNTVIFSFFYRYLVIERKAVKKSQLRYVPMILVIIVFYLTASRSGLIAFLITFFFCVCFFSRNGYLRRGGNFRIEFNALCIAIITGFLLGFLISKGVSYFDDHEILSKRILNISEASFYLRLFFWAISLAVFQDHFLLGVGLGNFKLFSAPYREAGAEILGFSDYGLYSYTKWAHNDLLQIMAETGGVVFSLVLFLVVFYLYLVIKYSFSRRNVVTLHSFFTSIFLLPFIIQSNFEYPFYHVSTLLLFFTFLGFFLSTRSTSNCAWNNYLRYSISSFLVLLLILNVSFIVSETKLGKFYSKYYFGNISHEKLSALSDVSNNKFSELRALQRIIPHYTRLAIKSESSEFAQKLLPFAERLALLQNLESHWFNLAVLYYRVEDFESAKNAANKAVELSPNHTLSWELIHIVNMKRASLETGKPIENFYPHSVDEKYQMSDIFLFDY